MQVSNHAEMRLKQRNGLNKRSCDRMAQRALEKGVRHGQTKGRLNKWISHLYKNSMRKGTDIRIYGDKAYIFTNDVLVTIIQVPSDISKDMKSMIKK